MAGLLGKAIAGAGAGGAQAMTGLAFPAYLEQQRQEAEKARQETLMQFQHQEGEANRALTQQQITESSRHNVAAEGLTGQQITEAGRHNVSTEGESSRHNKATEANQAEAFKNTGLSVQTTDQGLAIVDARNPGKPATILKGPDGKPLQSLKDSAATVTAVASGMRAAIDMGDMDRAKALNDVLLNIVQNKTGKPGGILQPTSRPPLSDFLGGQKPTATPGAQPAQAAPAQPSAPQPSSGVPSDSEFNAMLADAQRGGSVGKDYIMQRLNNNSLSLGQRMKAKQWAGNQ